MSTRSGIIVEKKDGTYSSVYCHFDGYPEGVGATLQEHYRSQERAEELVAGGDMSTLGPRCDCPDGHSYSSPTADCTVYYYRDRGEDRDGTAPVDSTELSEVWPSTGSGREYVYLWRHAAGVWRVGRPGDPESLQDLPCATSAPILTTDERSVSVVADQESTMEYIFNDKPTEDIRRHRDALQDIPIHKLSKEAHEMLNALDAELMARALAHALAFAKNPAEPAVDLDETVPYLDQARRYGAQAGRCLGAIETALSCLRTRDLDKARSVLERRLREEENSTYAAEQAARHD